jgi:uncharacterized secreted protein with C-terminal beta-propeller domain
MGLVAMNKAMLLDRFLKNISRDHLTGSCKDKEHADKTAEALKERISYVNIFKLFDRVNALEGKKADNEHGDGDCDVLDSTNNMDNVFERQKR